MGEDTNSAFPKEGEKVREQNRGIKEEKKKKKKEKKKQEKEKKTNILLDQACPENSSTLKLANSRESSLVIISLTSSGTKSKKEKLADKALDLEGEKKGKDKQGSRTVREISKTFPIFETFLNQPPTLFPFSFFS